MRLGLLVTTDGRVDYLYKCLMSLHDREIGVDVSVLVDDSGEELPLVAGFDEQATHPRRLGLAAALQHGWDVLSEYDIDYVLHVEEDFIFPEQIPAAEMAKILDGHAELAQVVLKRQAWSPEEHAAGGIIEMHPEDYEDRPGFLVHDRLFSLNPCLYPAEIMRFGWPRHGGEAEFTAVLKEKGYRFAMYGARHDPPRCLHIGARRSAGWKL